MDRSASLTTLLKQLNVARNQFPDIKKTKKANLGSYSYSYADFGEIWRAVDPILSANQLTLLQILDCDNAHPTLTTVLSHDEGEFIQGTVPLPPYSDAQGMGAAITYIKRYALSALLGIVTEDDDDGQAAMPRQSSGVRPAPPSQSAGRPQDRKPMEGDATEKQMKFMNELLLKVNEPLITDKVSKQFASETIEALKYGNYPALKATREKQQGAAVKMVEEGFGFSQEEF